MNVRSDDDGVVNDDAFLSFLPIPGQDAAESRRYRIHEHRDPENHFTDAESSSSPPPLSLSLSLSL